MDETTTQDEAVMILSTRVPARLRQALRVYAVQRDVKMHAVVIAAIQEALAKAAR